MTLDIYEHENFETKALKVQLDEGLRHVAKSHEKENKYANSYDKVININRIEMAMYNNPFEYIDAVPYMLKYMQHDKCAWQLIWCNKLYYNDDDLDEFAVMFINHIDKCKSYNKKFASQLEQLYTLIARSIISEDRGTKPIFAFNGISL